MLSSRNSADKKRICLSEEYFTGGMPLLTPNNSFSTCGGPEALTSTTVFEKCVVKTGSGGQERYILKSHPELKFCMIYTVKNIAIKAQICSCL